jgi:hypothetical protein
MRDERGWSGQGLIGSLLFLRKDNNHIHIGNLFNTVYPYCNDVKLNKRLMNNESVYAKELGEIARFHLPWEYNAQTHLEYQRPSFWLLGSKSCRSQDYTFHTKEGVAMPAKV